MVAKERDRGLITEKTKKARMVTSDKMWTIRLASPTTTLA